MGRSEQRRQVGAAGHSTSGEVCLHQRPCTHQHAGRIHHAHAINRKMEQEGPRPVQLWAGCQAWVMWAAPVTKECRVLPTPPSAHPPAGPGVVERGRDEASEEVHLENGGLRPVGQVPGVKLGSGCYREQCTEWFMRTHGLPAPCAP